MVFKCARLVIAFVIMLSNLTEEHYIPPPEFCTFAKVCNHTGVSVCGVAKRKGIARLFLDECDLFEYNCDNHKDYAAMNIEKCKPNATVSNSIKPSTITNASKLVNITEPSMKLTSETIRKKKSSTKSSSNVTCVCPAVVCPNITASITSPIANYTISSLNITVSSINTTAMKNSTKAVGLASTKVTYGFTNTTSSIETVTNDTSNKAITKLISTEAVSNLTFTEVTSILTTQTTINVATLAKTSSSTNTETAVKATCSSNPTTTTTKEIISLNVIISELPSKTTPKTINEVNKNATGDKEIKLSKAKCEYPKYCNRPRTWETTVKGETRDFYQILRAQFGDRVKLLRDTTHFPPTITKDFSNDDESFQFGYHNEKMNEIQ